MSMAPMNLMIAMAIIMSWIRFIASVRPFASYIALNFELKTCVTPQYV